MFRLVSRKEAKAMMTSLFLQEMAAVKVVRRKVMENIRNSPRKKGKGGVNISFTAKVAPSFLPTY